MVTPSSPATYSFLPWQLLPPKTSSLAVAAVVGGQPTDTEFEHSCSHWDSSPDCTSVYHSKQLSGSHPSYYSCLGSSSRQAWIWYSFHWSSLSLTFVSQSSSGSLPLPYFSIELRMASVNNLEGVSAGSQGSSSLNLAFGSVAAGLALKRGCFRGSPCSHLCLESLTQINYYNCLSARYQWILPLIKIFENHSLAHNLTLTASLKRREGGRRGWQARRGSSIR